MCGGQRINQHGSVEEIFPDGFVAWRGEFIFCWIFNWDMVMTVNANWMFYFETKKEVMVRVILLWNEVTAAIFLPFCQHPLTKLFLRARKTLFLC